MCPVLSRTPDDLESRPCSSVGVEVDSSLREVLSEMVDKKLSSRLPLWS